MKADIVDLNLLSLSFPEPIYQEVVRSNFLDIIEEKSEENSLIKILGGSGSGKTILLRQFCEKNSHKSLSIFISPIRSLTYDLSFILNNLIRQIRYLTKKEVKDDFIEDDVQLKMVFSREISNLKIYAQSEGPIYFVIDGLSHLTEDSGFIIDQLLSDLLPIGSKNIKFIFSLDNQIKNNAKDKIEKININYTSVQMLGLTADEVARVFVDFPQLTTEEFEYIRSLFKGRPSDVLALKAVLQNKGIEDTTQILSQLPKDMFEYSWKTIDEENTKLLKIMSLVVFSKRDLEITEISEILNEEESNIIKELANNLFFYVEENKILSKSESFIRQLKDKLKNYKKDTYSYLADSITKSENKNDFWLLPQYYEESGNYNELYSILDNPTYVSVIISSKSMSSLKMLVSSGLRVSNQTNSLPNIIKYSLEKSLIHDRSTYSKALEIEALMALNDEEKAISIARSLPVLEDKIQYLCFIAKNKREKKGVVQPEILNEIRQLYLKLDFDYLGGKGIEIASELISVDPELAIDLVEKTFDFVDDENSFDKVMVALSLEKLGNSEQDNYDVFETIHNKVKDEKIKDDFSALFHFSKNSSPKTIISDLKNVEALSARINMLAAWCEYNESSVHSLSIIKYAFSQLASSPEHQSNAGIYFKLSFQLLNQTEDISSGILELFESRLDLLEINGPTLQYVRLILNMIKGSDSYNTANTLDRIELLYLFISEIEDSPLKLEANSYFLNTLKELENLTYYNEKSDIEKILQTDIENVLKEIVSDYGYQEELLGKSLRILVKNNLELCLSTVLSVNTIENREKLYSALMSGLGEDFELFGTDKKRIILTEIIKILNNFDYDIDFYDYGVKKIIDFTFEHSNEDPGFLSKSLFFQLQNKVDKVREIHIKLVCLCKLVMMVSRIKELEEFNSQQIEDNILNLWSLVDVFPRKIQIGYEAVTLLAKDKTELSRKISDKILEEKSQYRFFESYDLWSYLLGIRLLIRSLKGVVNNESTDFEKYIDKINNLIKHIESYGEKAVILSNLLITLNEKVSVSIQRKIKKEIIDLINDISNEDLRYKATVIKKCAPALFLHSRAFADEQLNLLSSKEKDEVYSQVCFYYLTKTDNFEPFDMSQKAQYNCDYEDLINTLAIIDKIESDAMKYSFIKKILEVVNENNSTKLNNEMTANIKDKVNEIIKNNFNSPIFIKHEGYKLLSQIESILTFEQFSKAKIETVLQKVDLIPNISDRIFCKTTIASRIKKPKYNEFRDEILDDCEALIENINSVSEKVLRFEDMAESVHGRKGTREKKYITKAIDLIDFKDNSHTNSEKRLIDLAYQLDPEFADSLVSSISQKANDEDTKRLEKELNYLELKDKVTNDKGKEDLSKLNYKEAERLCKISWRCLGELNANTISSRKIELMGDYIRTASLLPLSESYPIYSWLVENSNRRNTSNGKFTKELFESIYVSCNFSLLKESEEKREIMGMDEFYEESKKNSILVKEGMREEAIQFLISHMEENEPDTIIICDPYFGKEELTLIREFQSRLDDVEFKVFTSLKNLKERCENPDFGEEFSDHWKLQVSHENPPFIEFCVAGLKDDTSPIHDRFILFGEKGFEIGGSLNGLGKQKEMAITELQSELYEEINTSLDHYFNNHQRYFRDNRMDVKISSFTI